VLYISLVVSAILLAGVWFASRWTKYPVATTLAWAGGACIVPMCLMMGLPAVLLQAAILFGVVFLAEAGNCGRQAMRPAAVASLLIAYAVVGWNEWGKYREEERKYADLRAAYPFESMEERLPRPVPPSTAGDPERLTRLEQTVDQKSDFGRMVSLRTLHDDTVDRFVNRPGFGVARMAPMNPDEKHLKPEPRDAAPPQLDYFHPGGVIPGVERPNAQALGGLHEAGILDFVNPRGFGYVKDRRHVAGFQSHAFSKMPAPVEKWEVARLELVGLLLHESPVVYESAKLPRMDELRGAPTRPLDEFEARALAALRAGADLHTRDGADGLRFVGAVRSTKQCLECHGGDRGALLGAFSYRLRPAK
jgi:hypothetical protein